jgi:phosphoserine phosphatase
MPIKRSLAFGLSVVSMCLFALGATGCKSGPEAKPAAEAKPPATLGAEWEPGVKASLEKLAAERGKGSAGYDPEKKPVVVFDFDNTCIRGDIGRAFYDYMIRERKFQFREPVWEALPADKRADIRAAWEATQALPSDKQPASVELQRFRKLMHQAYWGLCNELEPETCYPWQVRFYAGYTPDELEAMAHQVMEYELARPLGSEPIRAGDDDSSPAITSTGIRIHKPMLDLMQVLRAAGFELWIVTAGPQWVVSGAAQSFPIRGYRVLGMRTKLVDGKLTTEMEPPPTFRQGKVQAIEQFIGRRPVLAVGDSWTDAEMLAQAEHALLLDRGYEDLKRKATESGWWLQPEFPVQKQ